MNAYAYREHVKAIHGVAEVVAKGSMVRQVNQLILLES